MFHDIPPEVLARMRHLEKIDARDRGDGTPTSRRLRQIPPETGRFIALLAACAPAGAHLEVGTSGGYSGLWLALACRAKGVRLETCELLPEKAALARETFALAGLDGQVRVSQGDALQWLLEYENIAFCFVDTEKDLYLNCYDLVVSRLVSGGILVADNAISHAAVLVTFLDRARSDRRVDALVVPVGKGLLVARHV